MRCRTGKSTRNGIGSGAMIAIAVVGGVVVLILATIIFCCCRSRWRNRASAIEAATLAKSQPKVEPMTPTGPAPFAVNYPQFQVRTFLNVFPYHLSRPTHVAVFCVFDWPCQLPFSSREACMFALSWFLASHVHYLQGSSKAIECVIWHPPS